MKRFGLLLAAMAPFAGCGGGGGGKPSCSSSDPCGSGYYCAHTADGNVCWPDKVPPVISAANVSCSDAPCRRDSVLHVTATVTEESAMGTVTAVLDVDPDHPRTLELVSGSEYALDLPLADVPFPYFQHDLGVTVEATDEAGNVADDASRGPVSVTRAKWTKQLKGLGDTVFPLFSPALLPDGRIVVAGSDGSVHFVSKTNGDETRSSVAIGSAVNSPPAVAGDAIWIGGQNGTLHKLQFSGAEVSLTDCTTSSAILGPPAILGDRVLGVSSGVEILVAKPSSICTPTNLVASVTTPAAIDSTGKVLLGTGSLLQKYTVAANAGLTCDWSGVAPAPSPPTVGSVAEPPTIDGTNAIWTTATNGVLSRTSSSATTATVSIVPPISGGSTAAVVLADGSAVVGDWSGVLKRASAAGTPQWSTSGALSGHARMPVVLTAGVPHLLVPTSDGWLFAVRTSDGTVLWSRKLSGQSLEPANIWTEPGATTSTAYLAGADGNLYAIIVDGALDTAAPWPKAFHDPQNTSNAGVTP